ncbi:hypothetical protein TcWFU_004587 [Taenia crassiceps]|uniref:Uncharacterized protein n=1 Tax=Taenia crassiceps TaxID=6207 RepID=A0ABR4Q2S6_9CEST
MRSKARVETEMAHVTLKAWQPVRTGRSVRPYLDGDICFGYGIQRIWRKRNNRRLFAVETVSLASRQRDNASVDTRNTKHASAKVGEGQLTLGSLLGKTDYALTVHALQSDGPGVTNTIHVTRGRTVNQSISVQVSVRQTMHHSFNLTPCSINNNMTFPHITAKLQIQIEIYVDLPFLFSV